MIRLFRAAPPRLRLGLLAALLGLAALAAARPAAAQFATVTVQNDWPAPLVYVMAPMAPATNGNVLPKGRSTLQLFPNIKYLVYENFNPQFIATLVKAQAPGGELPLLTAPFLEITPKAGSDTLTIPNARVTVENESDRPAAFHIKVGTLINVPVPLAPGQSWAMPPSVPPGFVLTAGPAGAAPCLSFPVVRGWNYFSFPAGPDPCGESRKRAGSAEAPVYQVKQDRRYDQQSYLMAHNAGENWADGWWNAQQTYGVGDLLRNHGVRALELDVNYFTATLVETVERGKALTDTYEPDFYICHSTCAGSRLQKDSYLLRPLSRTLKELAAFMRDPQYRNEIVTVFIEFRKEADAAATDLGWALVRQLDESGLLPYVYWPETPPDTGSNYVSCLQTARKADGTLAVPQVDPPHAVSNGVAPTQKWPLVSEMVKANQRVVLFIDSGTYFNVMCLPYVWSYVRESRFPEFPKTTDPLAYHQDSVGLAAYIAGQWLKPLLQAPGVAEREQSLNAVDNFKKQERPDSRMLMRLNYFTMTGVGIGYQGFNGLRPILDYVLLWRTRNGPTFAAPMETPRYGAFLPNFLALDHVDAGEGIAAIEALNTCWGDPLINRCLQTRLNEIPTHGLGPDK